MAIAYGSAVANRRVVHLQHCFHYCFARWLRSRKLASFAENFKMVAQSNQDARQQITAAIAWCRQHQAALAAVPSPRCPRGTTCAGAISALIV